MVDTVNSKFTLEASILLLAGSSPASPTNFQYNKRNNMNWYAAIVIAAWLGAGLSRQKDSMEWAFVLTVCVWFVWLVR